MNTLIQKLWNQSIRNQLILGTAGILTLLISVFSYFTIHNHSDFLHKEAMAETQDRSLMLAVNSQVWVMANDYVGLEEVISNFEIYKDLIYAAVINMDGKVIAHTDKERIGQYVSDKARVNYLKHLLAQNTSCRTAPPSSAKMNITSTWPGRFVTITTTSAGWNCAPTKPSARKVFQPPFVTACSSRLAPY